jgi:hypothetical protein
MAAAPHRRRPSLPCSSPSPTELAINAHSPPCRPILSSPTTAAHRALMSVTTDFAPTGLAAPPPLPPPPYKRQARAPPLPAPPPALSSHAVQQQQPELSTAARRISAGVDPSSAPLRRRQLHPELRIEVRTPHTLFSFRARACRSRASSPELAEPPPSASPAAVPSPSPYPPPYLPSNVRELFSFLPSHPASQS